ncbi:MAG TPA: FGGY family carbohydrate kinase, partial [Anaerolineae bacterium]|nr:FGGY family carbohydrate kinase [Anaerolineae bacterium]
MAVSTEPLLAGLDVGTTNIKAVIFDLAGQPVAEASVSTPTYYPQPTWAYYKAEELWQRTVTALRQATSQLADPRRIVSVAVASMGEAAAPIDAHGQPTYDVIAWFDRRTQPQVDWLDRTFGKDHLFDISGLSLQPIFGLCKLLWLKENQPDAFARTVRWLNMADYIAYRLCGIPATDYSLASRTLALDLRRLRWADDLIREVGLSSDLFAPLCASGTRLGPVTPEAAAATGLPSSAQVTAGGHDHVCGALAVGVTEPGEMLNSMGTAEAIFVPLRQPVADPLMGQQGYTQGAHVIADHYYVLGGLYTSGGNVEWLREILGHDVDYATLIAEADQVPLGSLGVCFLPHLRLANPPYDDPKSRGAFIGLSTDVKRGALFRAVLESLAYEARNSLEPLLTYPEVEPLRKIYAIGGSTRNPLLMRIKAAVLNQPITVATVAEATSLGAVILGGLGAGAYSDVPSALAQLRHAQTVVEPTPDEAARYDLYFRQVYQQLYPTLRPLHHILHHLQ